MIYPASVVMLTHFPDEGHEDQNVTNKCTSSEQNSVQQFFHFGFEIDNFEIHILSSD